MQGKVALITGGGTGIGKGIATSLGRHGAKIAICSRKEEVINAAREELEHMGIDCLALPADIRDTERVEYVIKATIEKFGSLDIVVNNAAGNFPARIEDLSYNAFKTIVDIDLQGTFNVTKAAFTAWLKDHGGVVLNLTAPFDNMGVAWQAHAAAAKAGVVSFTRSAAVEWANLGIRVNGIAPGPMQNTEGVERMSDTLTSGKGAPRSGTVEDMANAVLFLASDAGRFISGVNLYIDGATGVDTLKVPLYE
jgi:peroxisomal 2,4-dienoyl-CoA reductase